MQNFEHKLPAERHRQTVQTQIRLTLKKWSNQGLPSLIFCQALCEFIYSLLALLYVMFSCAFVTFPYGFLGQVWYLIVSITDLCLLSYFAIQHCMFENRMRRHSKFWKIYYKMEKHCGLEMVFVNTVTACYRIFKTCLSILAVVYNKPGLWFCDTY